jgi:protein-S-isoprenylcysteine O-methyltransferase Ste14
MASCQRQFGHASYCMGLTLAVFAATIGLGVLELGAIWTPGWLQWAVGPVLIVAGNLIAWWGAFSIGLKATSGGKDELVTTGLYRYSRNPQYVADLAILLGFGLLFSSIWAWGVLEIGIAALAIAPVAEEQGLHEQYGKQYDDYRSETRRFL